ncbi:MAG: Hint domain-containing protein, partial [Candidatus Omnitrophota bacterium]
VLVGGVWKVAKDIVVGDQAVVARDCGFVNTPVLGIARGQVESRAVYNLSVEEDESFIAKGIVVHNCRCVLVAELDEEKMFVQKGGPGSGNFGHEGRPGEVGGSGPGSGGPLTSPEKVTSISDLERIANSGKLPSDTASYQYFYHAFRSRSTPDAVAKEGLKAGTTGGSVFLSKDEIRDLGAGYAVVRVPVGQAKESVDVVEQGLTYRQWTVSDVPVSDIVSIVREVPYGSGGHGTRENDLARWAIDHQGEDASDLPKQYRGWFNVQNAKSLKATPSIVIPEFERTNTRGD